MKSIKEKAEEYERSQCTQDYCWLDVEEAFETGANYVLEQIEKKLPSEDDRNLNDYGKALVWRLKECVKQLKK